MGASQSLLNNLLLRKLSDLAPDIDPVRVIRAGATAIRSSFPLDIVPGIVESYLYGLRAVYTLVIAFTGVAAIAGLFYPWRKLDLKK